MKIESLDRDTSQMLMSGFYRVPRFQRPYNWDVNNVEEFWQDAVVDSESDYFIGSMVVFREKDNTFGIVDGQQRLTTITMLLCALRDAFRRANLPDQASGLHAWIERADINNKPRYVLQTETSYPYLQEFIQKDGEPETPPMLGQEEQSLRAAYTSITQYLNDLSAAVQKDSTLSAEAKASKTKEKLEAVRDKVLGLKVILVTLDNEDDAYVIFETMNTRGKDLTLSDLVKGHLTKILKPKNAGVDLTVDKWAELVQLIEGSSVDLNMNAFLQHYWLSRYDYLAQKKLYKAIKRQVRKSGEARDFLANLSMDARIYREINETAFRKWDKQEMNIKGSLDALNLFRVKQPLPMLLSVMREYRARDTNSLKKKHVEDILAAIENFHFIFTAVTSQRSSGGISSMYASYARRLVQATTLQEKSKVLDELKDKLRAKLPGYAEFEAEFLQIRYTDSFTKQKKLVQYVLAKIDRNKRAAGLQLDYEQMTIEHLAAQNAAPADKVSDVCCGQIGNLLLVDQDLNGKLANNAPLVKRNMIQTSGIWLDSVLKDATSWGEQDIENRTKSLASLAYNEVWRL
jgi:uncharacterized protein with ParB-like and HNH nuclease domain